MSRSQQRKIFALLGCFFFVQFISVAAGIPLEATSQDFCELDKKSYSEGEQFVPTDNSDSICVCKRSRAGRSVEISCQAVGDDCIPIITNSESPKNTIYTELKRCVNDDASIPITMIKNLRETKAESMCTFGDIKLSIGDYFYHYIRSDTKNCVQCICEQSPKPTCVRPPECPLFYDRT